MPLASLFRTVESLVVPFLFGFVVAIWLVPLVAWLAHKTDAVARPNNRTLHQGEIPRLGGVALAWAVLLGLPLMAWWPVLEWEMWQLHGPHHLLLLLIVGGGGAFLLGLADDLFVQRALTRLIGQVLLGWLVAHHGVVPLVLPNLVGDATILLPVMLAKVFTVAWVVLMINATNFMDGMDGHILTAAFIQFLAYAAIFFTLGSSPAAQHLGAMGPFYLSILLLLMGSCMGVLAYNWPRASVFLGDGGSYFLGFVLALVPLFLAHKTVVLGRYEGQLLFVQVIASPLGMIIIASPFLVDVLFTLTRRLLRGHHPFTPHREHLYQRLVMTGMSHRTVLLLGIPFQVWNAILGFWAWCDTSPARQRAALMLCVVSWLYYYLIVRQAEVMHCRKQQEARANSKEDTP